MRKVVYICSFGHSGSTLLGLILGQHANVIALGELFTIKQKKKVLGSRPCSCGSLAAECEYWSKVIQNYDNELPETMDEEYSHMLNAFSDSFDDQTVFCDTSKNLSNLAVLKERTDIDLKVICLIKDFRAYVVSDRRKKRKMGLKISFIDALRTARGWYINNAYNIKYLKENNYDYMKIGYEELCLYPNESADAIFNFIGLQSNIQSTALHKDYGHMLFGNRMRKSSTKQSLIRYDSVWFTERFVSILSFLMPRTSRFNRKATYSNGFEKMWGR